MVVSSLTVVDWDDTLFPTSKLKEQSSEQLARLEEVVVNLLSELAKRGPTMIVTNSEEGWVTQCLKHNHWMRMFSVLMYVPVISARTRYGNILGPSFEWKRRAFEELLKLTSAQQIISIGDGSDERNASQSFATALLSKTIRTIQAPTAEQITQQCEVIARNVDLILGHTARLDLSLVPVSSQPQECDAQSNPTGAH